MKWLLRFIWLLERRRLGDYRDIRKTGNKMRKPKLHKYTELELKCAEGQRQATIEQIKEWQSMPWNNLANSQEAINFGKIK